jgi:sec-independent protein translocase protein TatA
MFEGLFQPTHLIIILVIILILFGPGKLPDLGKSLGKGIREFKGAVSSAEADADEPPAGAAVLEARAVAHCPSCGSENPSRQAFCGSCGAAIARESAAEV